MNADKRRCEKMICLVGFALGLVFGQSFEVASVKLNTARGQATMTSLPGGERLVARNMPLVWLIGEAYLVPNRQISGLPDGMATENYDIEAKAERPVSRAQMMLMLRSFARGSVQADGAPGDERNLRACAGGREGRGQDE
jgi:hypothetical protein